MSVRDREEEALAKREIAKRGRAVHFSHGRDSGRALRAALEPHDTMPDWFRARRMEARQ
jgi:hypothetical protein